MTNYFIGEPFLRHGAPTIKTIQPQSNHTESARRDRQDYTGLLVEVGNRVSGFSRRRADNSDTRSVWVMLVVGGDEGVAEPRKLRNSVL